MRPNLGKQNAEIGVKLNAKKNCGKKCFYTVITNTFEGINWWNIVLKKKSFPFHAVLFVEFSTPLKELTGGTLCKKISFSFYGILYVLASRDSVYCTIITVPRISYFPEKMQWLLMESFSLCAIFR